MKFYSLNVKNIQKPTPKSIQVDLEIPQELKELFVWKSGQFLRFKFQIDGQSIEREYSICTAPQEKYISFAVKEVAGAFVSKYVQENLQIGDIVEVSTPMGNFGIPSRPNEKRTLAAFTAGSGITPVMSILKDTLYHEEDVNFYLFYGNRTEKEVMFKQELDKLQQDRPQNLHLHYFYTEQENKNKLFEGRLNEDKLDLIINQIVDWDEVDEVLICGPKDMIIALANGAYKRGIPKQNIHYELFTPVEKVYDDEKTQRSTVKEVDVTFTYQGEKKDFKWLNNGNSLLDVLLDMGVDAPFSCKGGVCGTCRCTTVEGEVILGENIVLTNEDLIEKKILTCISHPKTEKLIINMDEF